MPAGTRGFTDVFGISLDADHVVPPAAAASGAGKR